MLENYESEITDVEFKNNFLKVRYSGAIYFWTVSNFVLLERKKKA